MFDKGPDEHMRQYIIYKTLVNNRTRSRIWFIFCNNIYLIPREDVLTYIYMVATRITPMQQYEWLCLIKKHGMKLLIHMLFSDEFC